MGEDGLHPTRRKVLGALARAEAHKRETPTEREICRAVGVSSSQTVHHHLVALEGEGYLRRREAPSRKRRPVSLTEKGWRVVGEMPLLGRISAGRGIEAVPGSGEGLAVAAEILFGVGGKERFVLEAKGDSMVGAGIESGDLLVFDQDPSPPDGSIVAALFGEASDEVTVKRLRRESGVVRLVAENPSYEDLVFGASEVAIQGRLAWTLKKARR